MKQPGQCTLRKHGQLNTESQKDQFLAEMQQWLILTTPESVFNTLFYLTKIREAENIFDTKMGLVHSPVGGNYYAGFWVNNQVEYSVPFFSYLGLKLEIVSRTMAM